MNKTILFFLALVLAATTACGRGSSNNNPVKEETMATEGNGKVIHLTKAEFLAKVYNFEKNPEEWKYEGDKPAIRRRIFWLRSLQNGSSYFGRIGKRIRWPDCDL